MNILSYRGFEELCETWEGVFLRDKIPLHKSFVTFGNFIDNAYSDICIPLDLWMCLNVFKYWAYRNSKYLL